MTDTRAPVTAQNAATERKDGFLRKAGPLVAVRLLTAGITFFIPLVLARWLDLEAFGTYKQLFLVANTLYYVLPFGIAQSLYYFVPRSENPKPFFVQTVFLLLGMGVLGTLTLGFAAPWVAHHFQNPVINEYRWLLAAYLGGMTASTSLELMMTCRGLTKRSAVTYLVSDGLRTVALMVPVLLGFGVKGLITAMAGFALLRVVAAWILTWRETGASFEKAGARVGLLGTQLAYAAPFGAAMLLNTPQQLAHQLAVSAAVAPAVFAIYSVGCFQLPLVELLYTPTSEMLMVRLGELERMNRLEESVEAFREAASKLAFAFFPLAAFLFAAAPEFISALFGIRYLDAVPLFRVGILTVCFAAFPLDGTLRARGETRYLFWSYLLKAAVTVPLVIFLVRAFGMMGGMVSYVVAELVGKGSLFLRLPRALSSERARFSLLDCLPLAALAKATLAAMGGAVAVVVLRALGDSTFGGLPEGFLWRIIPLSAAGLLFAAGYLFSLQLTGIRPMDAVSTFLRRRPA